MLQFAINQYYLYYKIITSHKAVLLAILSCQLIYYFDKIIVNDFLYLSIINILWFAVFYLMIFYERKNGLYQHLLASRPIFNIHGYLMFRIFTKALMLFIVNIVFNGISNYYFHFSDIVLYGFQHFFMLASVAELSFFYRKKIDQVAAILTIIPFDVLLSHKKTFFTDDMIIIVLNYLFFVFYLKTSKN